MNDPCQELREHIVELVEGVLDGTTSARLRAHAAGCPACERELALEALLVEALDDALGATLVVPDCVVPAPDPEPRPVLRRLRAAVVAAIAAAAVAVVGVRLASGPGVGGVPDEPRAVAGSSRTVLIRTVIESAADVPLPDDDLLALTAGVEAVVMRRPVERR